MVELPLHKNFSFSGSKSGGILKYTWFLWPDRPKEPKKVKEHMVPVAGQAKGAQKS